MTSRKRNDDLDIDESEDEVGQGYDSEAAEERRGGRIARAPGRQSKRQKISNDTEGDEDHSSAADESLIKDNEEDSEQGEEAGDVSSKPSTPTKKSKLKTPNALKPLTPSQLASNRKKIQQTGVIYLSRVPPFMKHTKLRSLLSPFGAIDRIFLSPEDPSSHTARVRSGGNKKRSFTDGWVEFVSKADAKLCAETLNARIVGGRKGNYYHDDVWNIRYLKGFKWHNLTDQIANENAERAARLRTEIARGRKEDREFVRNVERGKMLGGMEKKAAAKKKRVPTSTDADAAVMTADLGAGKTGRSNTHAGDDRREEKRGFQRQFRQTAVMRKGQASAKPPEGVTKVLSKIF